MGLAIPLSHLMGSQLKHTFQGIILIQKYFTAINLIKAGLEYNPSHLLTLPFIN